jgi:hypothetical protein
VSFAIITLKPTSAGELGERDVRLGLLSTTQRLFSSLGPKVGRRWLSLPGNGAMFVNSNNGRARCRAELRATEQRRVGWPDRGKGQDACRFGATSVLVAEDVGLRA